MYDLQKKLNDYIIKLGFTVLILTFAEIKEINKRNENGILEKKTPA